MTLHTFDASNWQPFTATAIRSAPGYQHRSIAIPRPFTASEADCIAANFDYGIIRGSMESQALISTARAQLQSLALRNVPRSVYPWVYGYQDPVQAIRDCIATYDDLANVKIAWDDLEDTSSFAGISQAQGAAIMRARFQAMRDLGYRPGLYTTPSVWQEVTGNAPIDDDVLVWIANWNGVRDLNVPALPGGQLVGHQYEPGSWAVTCGLTLDLSEFSEEILVVSPAPTPAPAPTDVQDVRLRAVLQDRFAAARAGRFDIAFAVDAPNPESDVTPVPAPPVDPPGVVTPAAGSTPLLSHTWAAVLSGLLIFTLMGFASTLNAVSGGALAIPHQLQPFEPYFIVPAILGVQWVLHGLRTGQWDPPMEAEEPAQEEPIWLGPRSVHPPESPQKYPMSDEAAFPHCDSDVLHRPKDCVYCDRYPDRQAARAKSGVNFTGCRDFGKMLCPSERNRPLETINRWGGNVAMTPEMIAERDRERADMKARFQAMFSPYAFPEWMPDRRIWHR